MKAYKELSIVALVPPRKHLPVTEQTALVLKAQAGDRAARHTLIATNMRLIISTSMLASRHTSRVDADDIVQEGLSGFNHAIDEWRNDKGANLITYATNWIKAHVRRYCCDNASVVRLPMNKQDALLRLRKFKDYWRASNEADMYAPVPVEYLMDAMNASRERIELLERLDTYNDVTVNVSPGVAGENLNGAATFQDMIEDENIVDADEVLSRNEFATNAERQIYIALKAFKPRERAIILHRYLSEPDELVTLEDLSDAIGLTRERIRQLEQRTLKRLSSALGAAIPFDQIFEQIKTAVVHRKEGEVKPKLTNTYCNQGCGRFIYENAKDGRCVHCLRLPYAGKTIVKKEIKKEGKKMIAVPMPVAVPVKVQIQKPQTETLPDVGSLSNEYLFKCLDEIKRRMSTK